MFRFTCFVVVASFLFFGLAVAQQPSGTSVSPAPGTHMEQSTVQTVGSTPNGAGATVTNPRPSPDAGTALPTVNSGDALVAPAPRPVTKTIGGGGLADPTDVADLLAPKPLKPSTLSLIGGTVKSIDQIQDHMTVRLYGSGNMRVKFDQRTHFYRDGKETTQLAVKAGDRIYLDTQLFEGKVFAKNVHIDSAPSAADASGQIVSFNRKSGDMVVRDQLAGSTVKFRVGPQTMISSGEAKTTTGALRAGALVNVKFSPRSRSMGTAEQVSIIAEPGRSFTYFGRVTHLDLRSGLLAIENQADGKTYEIHLPSRVPDDLTVGSQVTVTATFEGYGYLADRIEVNAAGDQASIGQDQSRVPAVSDSSDTEQQTDKQLKRRTSKQGHPSRDDQDKNKVDKKDDDEQL